MRSAKCIAGGVVQSGFQILALLLSVWFSAIVPLYGASVPCPTKLALLGSRGSEERIAKKAGLDYETDIESKGITRKKKGKGFVYIQANGSAVTSAKVLERIESLKIPFVYTGVIISSNPDSHLQYTAVDTSGKKQYRYHPDWNQARKKQKFERIAEFGTQLSKLRNTVRKDLAQHELSKEKVLATMIRILDKTAIRIGNEEYVGENETYGLSTLEKRHIKVNGNKIYFTFIGKADKKQEVELEDKTVAKVILELLELPGKTLFPYHSDEVNDYISQNMGEIFTAKDFRTWTGTVEAFRALKQSGATKQKAVEAASKKLGNTSAVAEKHYIHPVVLEAFESGKIQNLNVKPKPGLSTTESAVLSLIGH